MNQRLSDATLLTRWRDGDAAAGKALFTRHYRSLKRFYRNKVSADQIPDLIQETFVASIESRENIVKPERFRAYLLQIAYHVFCRHVKRLHRSTAQTDLDEVSVEGLDESLTSLVARGREHRLLLSGLRSIPINYQVVLELHYWEDLTTREIAEILGVPPGTIRSRLQRARDALEAAMARIARSPELLHSTLTRLDDWAASCGRELAAEA